MKQLNSKLVKGLSFLTLFLAVSFLFTSCSDDDETLNLVDKYNLAGDYTIQITPKMNNIKPLAKGEHLAKLVDKGNGVLELNFSGFRKLPMPFAMTVKTEMKVTKEKDGKLIIEPNGNGTFDANPPKDGSFDPSKLPADFPIPLDKLKEMKKNGGIHSKAATISGTYDIKTKKFNWILKPNIPLPVSVHIESISKK